MVLRLENACAELFRLFNACKAAICVANFRVSLCQAAQNGEHLDFFSIIIG